MDSSLPSSRTRLIAISGITFHPSKRFKRPLRVTLQVDGADSHSVLLRPEDSAGVHPLSNPLNLWDGSILSVNVQEKHWRLRPNKTLAQVHLASENIWPAQAQSSLDTHTKLYRIHLPDHEQNLSMNYSMLSSELAELGVRLGRIMKVSQRVNECMEGTRIHILSNVWNKINDIKEKNIIWIYGAPGSGKSSLSLTIKSRLQKEGRLVTYFRFDRNDCTLMTASALWRRVAYDLGDKYSSVRAIVLALLRTDKVDLSSTMDIFEFLIREPLSKLNDAPPDQPLVIIIDALDECGGFEGYSSSDRVALLQTLRRWSQLPERCKLIVTSRREDDIVKVLSPISTFIDIPSGNSVTDNPQAQASVSAFRDVHTFLENRFKQIIKPLSSLPPGWPGQGTIADMAHRAAGNFMWATTALNFIDSGLDPIEQLKSIVGDIPESLNVESLYLLYSTILEISFGEFASNSTDAHVLRDVLGTIVFAQRSLHGIDYTKLLTAEPMSSTFEMIRDRLRSVVDQGPTLQFVHTSFDDFLLSEECPHKYRIRMDESQCLLTKLCLRTLTEGLRFNLCNLETSSLKEGVRGDISPLLSYSCCFWTTHLVHTPFDELLMRFVKELLFDKLLYWFEAMSLLEETNQVSTSLLLVLNWSNSAQDEEFRDFIRDARRFIRSFAQPIAQSAPHVYISALPFAPENSSVARHFLPRFPRTLTVSTGKLTHWPTCVFTSEHHKGSVPSIAFSPDEKYFVSGSHDKTIRVYDSETGILISGPFTCTSAVGSSCFDPDGRRVWAWCLDGRVVGWDVQTGDKCLSFQAGKGLGDIIGCCRFKGGKNIVSASSKRGIVTLWNSETGAHLQDLLEIPREDKGSRILFSPDGRYMAWLGENDTIQIWKLEDGREIRCSFALQPQFRHAKHVSALAFSIDGHFLVSGFIDGTVLVWDAQTGDIFGRPLVTEKTGMTALAYCHESRLLVSASGNPGTVWVWDTSTHQEVLGPLEHHTSQITTISLSRDGRRTLTASSDGTVKMWDLQRTGVLPVAYTSTCHTEWVERVAFSPDGNKLASLGEDKTVRIWDSSTGNPLLSPIQGHLAYSHIIFSPDGSRILAFESDDGTLQAWNADNGAPVHHQDLTNDDIDRRDFTQLDHLAFRTTDERLVGCSRNGNVYIWNLEDAAITEGPRISNPQPSDGSEGVEIVALSPDGVTAIVRDNSRHPRHFMWSTITCQSLPLTFADDEHIYEVVYSPSGRFFVATSPDRGSLRVWNTATGELVAHSPIRNGMVNCLAFSPDDCHIAFSYDISSPNADTSAIWIWNSQSRSLTSWLGHRAYITTLVFSPDGKKLASGSGNGQIRIWDTTDLLGHPLPSGGFLGADTHMRDGWITDEDGKVLFWVPEEYRPSLFWPRNLAVIGGDGILTKLDLSRFRHGINWTECFKGTE